MVVKVRALERILAIIYVAAKNKKRITRKDLGAFYYIIESLLEENSEPSEYKVYPDGVYSGIIDRLIDYLIYLGLIDISNETLKLTDSGRKLAEEICASSESKNELKIIEKLSSYRLKTVWSLAYNISNPSSPTALSQDVLSLIKELSSLENEKGIKYIVRGIEK